MIQARLVGEFRVASSHRDRTVEIFTAVAIQPSTSNQLPLHLTPPNDIEGLLTINAR